MIRFSRTAPLLVATVASALLVAGPAYAADPPAKPIVGTAECTALVEKDDKVVAANQGSAGGLPAATKEATDRLCEPAPPGGTAGSTDEETTELDPAAGSESNGANQRRSGGNGGSGDETPPASNGASSSGNAGSAGASAKRTGGDKNCPNFATQREAQEYFESIGGSAAYNADRLDKNRDGVACENNDDDEDNPNPVVTTTGDDESKADTSGEQVTEVPEGSAQTGGNS